MLVHFIPVSGGLSREEVEQRIKSGWVYYGRQAVSLAGQLLKPGQPLDAGVADYDIWVLPEPMVPVSKVASVLVAAYVEGEDADLLDDLARLLFGFGIAPLAEMFRAGDEAQQPVEVKSDAEPTKER